ncbi:MAG: hypothetical protein KIH01_02845 [Candidatus Freyarchaeota archaeon]|nr:hypothetical protein [Candidatus Jordarchaeia archaeon]
MAEKDAAEKLLEAIAAVKAVLDDFSKAVFVVFGEVRTSLSELKNTLSSVHQMLSGLVASLAKTEEILNGVKRIEELLAGKAKESVGVEKIAVPVQAPPLTEGALTVRSFGVRVSPAFSQVIELIERNRPAEDIARALETARDQLQSRVHGPIFYEISQLIKQLRMSGAAKLDIKTAEEIMSKLEEWSERIKR